MTKAAELAKMGEVLTNSQIGGRRNIVINGAMQVAQRGTSVSSIDSSGYKTVDRWYTNASGATFSQSQESVTVGGETGLPVQFTKFLKHSTTGNDNTAIYQYVEDVDSIPSGNVTISFYAKGTTPNGGLKTRFFQNFGSGGSTEIELTSETQSNTLTSTWQRFTATITIPSISGKTVGTSSYLIIGFGQGSSTSTDAWVLDITGVQLEVGSQATPFEHRSFGEELQLCQRYYTREGAGSGGVYKRLADGICGTTTAADFMVHLSTPMRAAPTLETSGNVNHYLLYSANASDVCTALVLNNDSDDGTFNHSLSFYGTVGSGLVAGDSVQLITNANGSYYLAFDAEL